MIGRENQGDIRIIVNHFKRLWKEGLIVIQILLIEIKIGMLKVKVIEIEIYKKLKVK